MHTNIFSLLYVNHTWQKAQDNFNQDVLVSFLNYPLCSLSNVMRWHFYYRIEAYGVHFLLPLSAGIYREEHEKVNRVN